MFDVDFEPTIKRNNSGLSSPLKWHGGKHYLAKKIIELMPPHLHYVEPYADRWRCCWSEIRCEIG